MSDLYDHDVFAWANQQAALLGVGKLSDADIANIAEEIESMRCGEKRELVNRLNGLLMHVPASPGAAAVLGKYRST
nr:DUF29 family protein [uncultured Rhodopila sp.]